MNDLKMPLWFLVAGAMMLAAAATAAAAQKDPSLPAETVGAISDHLSVRFPIQGQTALENKPSRFSTRDVLQLVPKYV